MSKKTRDDNPGSALAAKVSMLEQNTRKIELALWGQDGRHGMVKDITDIKGSLRLWGQLKTFGLGIASTVVAALIIALAAGVL